MPKPHSFFLPESYPDPLPTPDAPTADAPNPHPDLLPDSLFAPGVVRFASFNNLYKVQRPSEKTPLARVGLELFVVGSLLSCASSLAHPPRPSLDLCARRRPRGGEPRAPARTG
jgi:hypothetical protein